MKRTRGKRMELLERMLVAGAQKAGRWGRLSGAPTKSFAEGAGWFSPAQSSGSRFWAPGEDESSDDDVDPGEQRSEGEVVLEDGRSEDDFVQTAMDDGFTVDEILKVGEHLLGMATPRANSCPREAGLRGGPA
ncbi:hypothetical protein E2562_001321 [Oryza meyeriana var. granulata]|uniref:Uncharacterized protein n=1 Tax=Oryza meyeriana var. granulata TaxID=110450 RepID=A0A6G1DBD6_9ORYZ|nr:hypothetical protein E2562_001321 [Oryza meyeriana var. granulata]